MQDGGAIDSDLKFCGGEWSIQTLRTWMVLNRRKVKGRMEGGSFVAIPHVCLNHENFRSLSPYAVKLFIDLFVQYNGRNNGDFCATWSYMKKRGWRSQATLQKTKKELLDRGWIIVSRQGGRHKCSLYAVTFQPIDECKGKLDVASTRTAPGNWKGLKIKIPATARVLNYYASCIN